MSIEMLTVEAVKGIVNEWSGHLAMRGANAEKHHGTSTFFCPAGLIGGSCSTLEPSARHETNTQGDTP